MRNEDKKRENLDEYFHTEKSERSSKIKGFFLLSIEDGVLQRLQELDDILSKKWSATDSRTAREVLENEYRDITERG